MDLRNDIGRCIHPHYARRGRGNGSFDCLLCGTNNQPSNGRNPVPDQAKKLKEPIMMTVDEQICYVRSLMELRANNLITVEEAREAMTRVPLYSDVCRRTARLD